MSDTQCVCTHTHAQTNYVGRYVLARWDHLLKEYNRNYPTFTGLDPSSGDPKPFDTGYDCITEMVVEDDAAVAEMTRIFNDPEINPILVRAQGAGAVAVDALVTLTTTRRAA